MKLAIVLASLMQWDMQPASAADWDMNPPTPAVAWSITPVSLTVQKPEVLLDSLNIEATPKPLATDDAAHTPMAEIVRVLDLLPRPKIGFVDLGCGYDARWCIAAAEKWGCRVTGVENDPARAAAARERVRNLGLDHLITIVEGDVGTAVISGDVAVAYLYPETLARIKPRLEYFTAFASYLHQPPGLPATKNGDTWLSFKQPQYAQQTASTQQTAQRRVAYWNGVAYARPVCTSGNCAMCAYIRRATGY